VSPDTAEAAGILQDILPRLSYDEILNGELEKSLTGSHIESVQLSSGDYVQTLIFSLAMFNALSKHPGG
jgi:hypothetical protein